MAWRRVPAREVDELLRALVDALTQTDPTRPKGKVHLLQLQHNGRVHMVVGVLQGHLKNRRSAPAARLGATTQTLRVIAQAWARAGGR